jgi:hypothetical protein
VALLYGAPLKKSFEAQMQRHQHCLSQLRALIGWYVNQGGQLLAM